MFSSDRVVAVYLVETAFPLDYAAEVIAGEQSTGTFVAVPGETEELKRDFGARVESVEPLAVCERPSLPGARVPKGTTAPIYQRGILKVSFPLHNFGPSLPNLLSTVAGNLYELGELSGLRLLDLELPAAFAQAYPGPQFGILGTRKLVGVYDRPLIGTIVKPSIGLQISEYGPMVRKLAEAGIDFIKDDELCADPPGAPLAQRVGVVMAEVERAADKTGKKLMYAFNITGDIETLKKNHDLVLKAGGNCVMVSINSIGLSGVAFLRKGAELVIHGHRNQWGAMTRCPLLGMEFRVYQKLCRLAGVDHLHTNGFDNKFSEENQTVVQSIRDCLEPLFGGYSVMPVLSSAQWAGSAVPTYAAIRSMDLLHLAGGGILAHPGGLQAGVLSMQQGWEAVRQGIPLDVYAEQRPALKQAIEKFSGHEPAGGPKP